MPCYHTLLAYQLQGMNEKTGKSIIVFKEPSDKIYKKIYLPCNNCIGCRIDRSRSWALRCVHESSLHKENSFITITYNDENAPADGSLNKKDFVDFLKRFRKTIHPKKIRFFHCGEYGEKLKRPHHHACIFGYDFPDKIFWTQKKGIRLYRSAMLEQLWPYGFSSIGDVSYESAAYVARYVMKKIVGDSAIEHYTKVNEETGEITLLEPEYITMSRRPGIAKHWFEKFKNDCYPKDQVTVNGKKNQIPKYYDKLYEIEFPEKLKKIKEKRLDKAISNKVNTTINRSFIRERVKKSQIKTLIRSYENEGKHVLNSGH